MLENVGFEVEYGAELNENFKHSDGWTCTISYEGREIEIPFYMGAGHHGREPELEDVLNSCFMSAYALDEDFNEWCDEYGYDNDSISALKIYNSCREIGEKLKYLFKDDYDEIGEEVRELDL